MEIAYFKFATWMQANKPNNLRIETPIPEPTLSGSVRAFEMFYPEPGTFCYMLKRLLV